MTGRLEREMLTAVSKSFIVGLINLEIRCAKFIWFCLNSDNSIVKTIAKSAKCSIVYQSLKIIIDIFVISIQ